MKSSYPNTKIIINKFLFLEEFGFRITREENLNFGSYVEFKGNGIKICLDFEFKSYIFSIDIYKNEELQYSDSAYGKEIISLCELAKRHFLIFDCSILQPNKELGYEASLDANAKLLKELVILQMC